ncbi:MAG: glycosyltransferase family 4 protein [Sulfuricurvum sp.]|uniref:glycosyltransferase family 4 protein n=1 Tax=Sulfuricurvum sp. TaxID=2025608 RepID=UPI0026283095|nr:glycosyltransferase family 4 protein [Sulfuricurvum sp.]MDD2367673.1 glycosyltransferase family 4 protein [Sulfuricurvum sp.]MDD2950010.1 glycosyltransferase family 4 protein [Sulfuricurvum sp.]MDD5118598.1 glycosyltransferase family 4 protein [Sulfuricurvum sp.]
MKSVLLIGPIANKKDSTKTGGVIVLFLDLLQQFDQKGIKYSVIDTNKENYPNKVIALLCIWYQLLIKSRHFDHLSVHCTIGDFMFIAPVATLLAKILRQTVSLRKFGGDFKEDYDSLNIILKPIVSWTLKNSDANFFETKYLVNHFSSFNQNTYWFPNVRKKVEILRSGPFQKRFIFIGTITREKGVIELLEASTLLDESYTIHLYGPIAEDMKGFDFSPYRAKYQRALNPKEVPLILKDYDVLILPSYREGYPGIIIEALSVGLPIIVTELAGIKEMIDEKCAIFIHSKNTNDIKNSVECFDEVNYKDLSENTLKCFESFDSDIQTPKFIQMILNEEQFL